MISNFLTSIRKHVQLNQDEEAILVDGCVSKKYLRGEFIGQEGDICRFQSFIVKGLVKTYFVDNNGTEHIIAFGVENWWVGDLGSIITQTPADFNVQCLEDTSVIQISKEQLDQLYIAVPKMERFFRMIIQNAYVNSQKRIVRNFSLSAKERYLFFVERYPEVVQRVPQYMIASYLGITKEFLSHLRSQISKEY